jgi:hypothetical protein
MSVADLLLSLLQNGVLNSILRRNMELISRFFEASKPRLFFGYKRALSTALILGRQWGVTVCEAASARLRPHSLLQGQAEWPTGYSREELLVSLGGAIKNLFVFGCLQTLIPDVDGVVASPAQPFGD